MFHENPNQNQQDKHDLLRQDDNNNSNSSNPLQITVIHLSTTYQILSDIYSDCISKKIQLFQIGVTEKEVSPEANLKRARKGGGRGVVPFLFFAITLKNYKLCYLKLN